MGCTDAYLKEHPCDIPWMPDETGACKVLIEDHINENGPSRRICTAYTVCIAFLYLILNAQSLADALEASSTRLRGQQAGLGRLVLQPQILRILAVIYSCVAILIQAVDIDGYGGRLPVLVWVLLVEQASVGLMSSMVISLCAWYRILGDAEEIEARNFRIRIITAVSTVCFVASFFVLPVLELYTRPADAALGIVDARLATAKGGLVTLFAGVITADFTYEYRRQNAKLYHKPSSGAVARDVTAGNTPSYSGWPAWMSRKLPFWKPQGNASPKAGKHVDEEKTRTALVRVLPSLAISKGERARRTKELSPRSALETTSIVSSRRTSLLASVRGGPPRPRRQQSHGAHHQSGAMTESILHQMKKLVIVGWLLTAASAIFFVAELPETQECWVWDVPPDRQWLEFYVASILMAIPACTVLPMQTQRLGFCQGWRSSSPVLPDDDEYHGTSAMSRG